MTQWLEFEGPIMVKFESIGLERRKTWKKQDEREKLDLIN